MPRVNRQMIENDNQGVENFDQPYAEMKDDETELDGKIYEILIDFSAINLYKYH